MARKVSDLSILKIPNATFALSTLISDLLLGKKGVQTECAADS